MVRYIGLPSSGSGSIPLQNEATTYFAAMTTPPSIEFKAAVNEAIYHWKEAGVWSLILGMWLFCAETEQAALLSVIGDAPRNATKTGAPTFTSLKGFSGFSSANGLTMPITSAILVDDAVCPFVAMKVAYAGSPVDHALITCDAGDTNSIPGVWQLSSNQINCGTNQHVFLDASNPATFLQGRGVLAGDTIHPGCISIAGGVRSARSSNYRTKLINNNSLSRLMAYGFLAHTATNVQRERFLSILSELLSSLDVFA